MAGYVESPHSCYYFRSPLTLYLHRATFHLVRPFGLRGADAMAICSAAAGGVFLLALLSISRHPLFLAFNLLAGNMFLFFGHVENYAWVNALLVLYLALLRRHLVEKSPLWPAASVLFLACLFHMLALFTLPTLFFAIWGWDSKKRRPRRLVSEKDFARILLGFLAAAIVVIAGPLVFDAAGLDNNFQRLVPLPPNPNPGHFYFTLFSSGHLQMLAYFHWKSSAAGLFFLVAMGWAIRGPWLRFLLGATLCSLAWTSLWHPDMGAGDWDLFCSFAFPLNMLNGALAERLWRKYSDPKKKSPKNPLLRA